MENIEIVKTEEKVILPVITVKFYETEIDCVLVDDNPNIIVKSVCEDIGLNVPSAYSNINNDEILAEVCAEYNTDNPKYMGKKVKCMPIQYLHGWLFGISTGKVSPEVKPRLLQFKREVYQVLFNYFFGRVKTYDQNTRRRYSIKKRIKEIDQTINKLMLERQDLEGERKLLSLTEFKELG